jgi:signal transduction histidine kinase
MILELLDMEESEEERNKLTQQLFTASDRLKETIADLNEIIDEQYKSGKAEKEVNLAEYFEKTKQILTTEIKELNVEFNTDIPEDLSFIYNPSYLESILLNLTTNAIKYRHPDRNPVIELKAKEVDGHIHLLFRDNGIGIDLNKFGDKLFGMYQTFHGNENAKGIGLFITKNQIETMGGSIEVESEPSKGTTFKIQLN